MNRLYACAALAALCFVPLAAADEPAKKPKPVEVPYRLTKPKHILVRAKINGKGPFNFIVDTGAPALFISTAAAKKIGIKPDENGWGTFDRFEIEGGLVMTKCKGRIETPPQVEGMNALGLAGVELHGMIGYDILAHYRLEIDFTRDKMTWTPLDYKPKAAMGLGGRGNAGGLDLLGSILKTLGSLLGSQASPPTRMRPFLGVELKDDDDNPIVQSVLAEGPAGKGGIRAGDRITHIQGRSIADTGDVSRAVGKHNPGDTIKFTVKRGQEKKEITVKLGEGL
jgi:hypothetical protein